MRGAAGTVQRASPAWGLVALLALAGCGKAPEGPAGTGAREAANRYFDALVRGDWPGAYALLDPGSKAQVGADRFARLAQDYRRGLGFDPDAVRVTACDERGDEAIAHVTLTGRGAGRHRFKDAVALRRDGAGWAVVLPANFGRVGRP